MIQGHLTDLHFRYPSQRRRPWTRVHASPARFATFGTDGRLGGRKVASLGPSGYAL